ncbi:MAG TPA: biotin/lipoyl-containing protein [Ktedonobacterales bacterium]|nr:biotin/lipoyl-containing protein [Ktedonobacterales bacterium]
MRYIVTIGERAITVETPDPDGAPERVSVDGAETAVDWRALGAALGAGDGETRAGHFSLLAGQASYDVYVRDLGDAQDEEGARAFEVTVGARTFTIRLRDERTQALERLTGGARHAGDAVIRAPMPGLVSNVLAAEGQAVERGQAVVVLEAMKMENELATPRPGVVKSVHVTKGQTVNQGDTLVIVGDAPGDAEAAPDGDEAEEEIAD